MFSPAASALKYKNVVRTAGVEDDKTAYQGQPNEENDRLWEKLYSFGMTEIPMKDASQLANPTVPISGDPVATIYVFHEIHCLVTAPIRCDKASCAPATSPQFHMLSTQSTIKFYRRPESRIRAETSMR
ncbi:hypothetical protein P171DRAFT_442428 [Karstenula rhodostoma CBS 690.94]|uniref:Uncharacterized protein n=1 Tax=Karstenula rhodostoma CBS 690.94 TaxID=1392251 RepID=A0A9P4UEN1_9PLEO|nr:hypothetical protein P171DRAFT_442428 [Karstenula rhodostoma CBS 690.94]